MLNITSTLAAAPQVFSGSTPEDTLMLQELFKMPLAINRHRATLFGPHIDGYLKELHGKGYDRLVLRQRACIVTSFGQFLAERGVRQIARIRGAQVERFVVRSSAIHKRRPFRFVVGELLEHLQWTSSTRVKVTRTPKLIQEFYLSLVNEKGLKQNTIEQYRHFIGKFLKHLRSTGSGHSFRALTPRQVDAFIVKAGREYGRRTMACVCCVVRGFLRYLYRREVLARDLSSGVVAPRFYALERIPCALPWKVVCGVAESPDVTTSKGIRDRAMLMLLKTYGVRAGEVAMLRLEDIDWTRGLIRFRRCKPGHPLSFPLTNESGEALVAYLQQRPQTDTREIFVREVAPHVALRRGSTVSIVVRGYFIKAGISATRKGAYLIRHSLAVALVRGAHPLKTVTDVLGHRDPHVAFKYTKLALEDLHGVAIDVKEVLP